MVATRPLRGDLRLTVDSPLYCFPNRGCVFRPLHGFLIGKRNRKPTFRNEERSTSISSSSIPGNPMNLANGVRALITIRPFEQNDEDYRQAVEIWNAVWVEYPDTVEEWKESDERHSKAVKRGRFLAEVEGQAVGYASYNQSLWLNHPGKLWVGLNVLPAFRKPRCRHSIVAAHVRRNETIRPPAYSYEHTRRLRGRDSLCPGSSASLNVCAIGSPGWTRRASVSQIGIVTHSASLNRASISKLLPSWSPIQIGIVSFTSWSG